MSLARIYRTKKTRKEFTCSGCRKVIPVGSPRISFAVGFRAPEQSRHDTPECRPTNSQLESSNVAEVYAAMESVDLSSCETREDLENAVQEVADACENVASEYESSEMYEINADLQERAETVRSAGEELGSWADSLDDEPTEDDPETWGEESTFDDAHNAWLEGAREEAQNAIDNIELP